MLEGLLTETPEMGRELPRSWTFSLACDGCRWLNENSSHSAGSLSSSKTYFADSLRRCRTLLAESSVLLRLPEGGRVVFIVFRL